MIRIVRYLSTKKGKGIPDYNLDVNPYRMEVKENSKIKKDEKNKSNT